ncbi:MAG: S1C family serine protease [Candidatus Nanopelagicales bacterium]
MLIGKARPRVAPTRRRAAWGGGARAGLSLAVVALSLSVALATPAEAAKSRRLADLSPRAQSAASQASLAVVNIDTVVDYGSSASAGTGIVISSDGVVLTNHHVIDGATAIDATSVASGQDYTATVLGYDSSQDIAVLKLRNASGLPVADLGNSATLKVGALVVAIGNAGGAGGAPTYVEGRVSGLDKAITLTDTFGEGSAQLTGLIKVTAKVRSGQSGGPLVEADGDVIGIDTAASVSRSGSTTAGWAIPINKAISVSDQIRAGRSSGTIHIGETPFLGVQLSESHRGVGVAVSSVVERTAAANMGILRGDRIVRFNGVKITSAEQLTELIAKQWVGSLAVVGWVRSDGTSKAASATLGPGPVGN